MGAPIFALLLYIIAYRVVRYVSNVSIIYEVFMLLYYHSWMFYNHFIATLYHFLGLTYWPSAQCPLLFFACFLHRRKSISNGVCDSLVFAHFSLTDFQLVWFWNLEFWIFSDGLKHLGTPWLSPKCLISPSNYHFLSGSPQNNILNIFLKGKYSFPSLKP